METIIIVGTASLAILLLSLWIAAKIEQRNHIKELKYALGNKAINNNQFHSLVNRVRAGSYSPSLLKAAAHLQSLSNRVNNLKEENKLTKDDFDLLLKQIQVNNLAWCETYIENCLSLHNIREKITNDIKSKYSPEIAQRIFNKEIWLGMKEEHLMYVKGVPDEVEIEESAREYKRVVIYGNKYTGDIFTFVNNVLTKYKDR